MPNPPDLVAEVKRRIQKLAPTMSEAQITAWLANVEQHDGRLVLAFDGGVFAEYPRQPATHADSQ